MRTAASWLRASRSALAGLLLCAGPLPPAPVNAAEPAYAELRIYAVLPGKLHAFRNRWCDHAVPIYKWHGLHSIGWWVSDKKDAAGHDQFACLLAGESVEAIQKFIAAFHQDPDWKRVEKETEQEGKLRSGVEAFKMKPADFSRLK